MEIKGKSKIFLLKKLKGAKKIWIEFHRNEEIEATFNINQEFKDISFISFNKDSEVIERAYIKKEAVQRILLKILNFTRNREYKKISLYHADGEYLLMLNEK